MINRIIFPLALLGMVLTVHLWIQEERGFDAGCWGLAADAAVSGTSDCHSASLQPARRLLGLPTAVWGYGFYLVVAALTLVQATFSERTARSAYWARQATIGIATLYSFYLLYFQAEIAKAFCPLCVVSAILVIILALLLTTEYLRGGFRPVPAAQRSAELGYAGILALLAGGGLVGVLLFADRIAIRRIDDGSNPVAFENMLQKTLPHFIDQDYLDQLRRPRMDRSMPNLGVNQWIGPNTPVLGSRAGVTVIAFLDPNCPHCPGIYETLERLARTPGHSVGVYVFSRVLWPISQLQSEALELSKSSGNYFAMWRLQFAHLKPGGLQLKDIADLCDQLHIGTGDLAHRLDGLKSNVLLQRDRARAARINATPTIFIAGIPVASTSTNERDLTALVHEAIRKRSAARFERIGAAK